MSIRKQAAEQVRPQINRHHIGAAPAMVDRFQQAIEARPDVGADDPAPITSALDAIADASVAIERLTIAFDAAGKSDLALRRARLLITEAGTLIAAMDLAQGAVIVEAPAVVRE